MDPDYLVFVNTVNCGSLSAAGRHLGISPAMMSKRIARLESRLGAHLLQRTTRKIALTEIGSQLFRDISAILASLQAAEDRAANRTREPAGPLRVSAPTSFGRMHVAPLVAGFLAQYPQVELELDLSDAYIDLATERFDVAIRITAEIPASLDARFLSANRRILCASPQYLQSHGVPTQLADLKTHRLLATEGQFPWRLKSSRGRRVLDGFSHVRTNSSEIVRELTLSGVGIALRSLWDVENLLANGRLVPVLTEWEGPDDLGVYAVYPKTDCRPAAITAFVTFLAQAFADASWNRQALASSPSD